MMAHLDTPDPSEARRWLQLRGWADSDLLEPALSDMLKPGSYVLRPFFLSELAKAGSTRNLEGTPRVTIINTILQREAKLLAESLQLEIEKCLAIEKCVAGLRQLYRQVAMDMAERESDTVDIEYLSFVCEFAFDGYVDGENLRKLKHRIGSAALFERDAVEHLRRFPHSEVQNLYVIEELIAQIVAGHVPTILRRGVVGSDLLESFIEVFERERADTVSEFVRRLVGRVEQETSGDRLPMNITSLLLATYARPGIGQPTRLAYLTANEVVFRDVLERVTLEQLTIDQLDARGADLTAVKFNKTQVAILRVNKSTRFGMTVPETYMVQDFEGDHWTTITRPDEITNRLRAADFDRPHIGVAGAVRRESPLLSLFDRIYRRSLRRFYFRPDDQNDPNNLLIQHPLWPEIERILEKSGRLIRKNAPMSGTSGALWHIKNAEGLLRPDTDEESAEIRQRVIARGIELQGQQNVGS